MHDQIVAVVFVGPPDERGIPVAPPKWHHRASFVHERKALGCSVTEDGDHDPRSGVAQLRLRATQQHFELIVVQNEIDGRVAKRNDVEASLCDRRRQIKYVALERVNVAVIDGRLEAIDGDRGDVDAKALLQRKFFGEVQEQPTIAAA